MKNPFRRGRPPRNNMDTGTNKPVPETDAGTNEPSEGSVGTDIPVDPEGTSDTAAEALLQGELDALRTELQAVQDKYVRLYAEFDNFRKRSAKEKLDLMQYASEGSLKQILPVLDDLERAMANNDKAVDIDVVKEGFALIQQKLLHILAAQGLKAMEDDAGQLFDTDRHEAITRIPAPDEARKGHVIEVVEKGYTLHDKVVRYAKVVVGA